MGLKKPLLLIYITSSLPRNKETPASKEKSHSWPPKEPDHQPPVDLDETWLLWTAPQPLLNDSQCLFPKTHASSARVLNMLSSTALLTNVGDVIGLPQDTTKIDAWNHPKNQPHVFENCDDYDDYISADTDYNQSSKCWIICWSITNNPMPHPLFISTPFPNSSSPNYVFSHCFSYLLFYFLFPTNQKPSPVLPPWRRPLYSY